MTKPASRRRIVELRAVGDVAVDRGEPDSAFALVASALRAADITYGNCESTYSGRGSRNPHARGMVRADPRNATALPRAGFDVMSFANNHHMDACEDGFYDTLQVLADLGIETCGAGANLTEARRPAIVRSGDTTVAFLAYSSILWPGYAATSDSPGCTPLRVATDYEQGEPEQPGSPPRIHTTTSPEDLAGMEHDIRTAKQHADVVVVTPHWGLHFVPGTIADYETEIAQAAIDAGADLILGCHQHVLKPIQIYRGKVIFHGLGNFVMDVDMSAHADSPALREMQDFHAEYAVAYQPDYPTYPFHASARSTMIARARIENGTISEVGFLPCLINRHGQPALLGAQDPAFDDLFNHVVEITKAAGFEVPMRRDETGIVVDLGSSS
ncbi:CapA family protein [Nocardia jiangxiensis]|uniref:CapA family protein n=1 Tax=Nocardia jiangxiensis TaxID=282685 RepID=A0ABW6SC84_9NOCA